MGYFFQRGSNLGFRSFRSGWLRHRGKPVPFSFCMFWRKRGRVFL